MKEKQLKYLIKQIKQDLRSISSSYWNNYVGRYEYMSYDEEETEEEKYILEDNKTSIYENTKRLFHKICLFFELSESPFYLQKFKSEFEDIINDKKLTLQSHVLYYDDESSMKILYDFGVYLNSFPEFDYEEEKKIKYDKLKLILENTNQLISKTNTKVKNETSIYKTIRWFIEIIYPSSRGLNKARFISKFKTYHPDILVPEIYSAIEYKFIKKGESLGNYIDQLKTDADSYKDDPEYKFFYAVIVFEDKTELNKASIEQAVYEKKFPNNWVIIPL